MLDNRLRQLSPQVRQPQPPPQQQQHQSPQVRQQQQQQSLQVRQPQSLQVRQPQSQLQLQLQPIVMVWVQIASDSTMGANCAGVGYQPAGTLSSCESYCLSLSGCNAVDWKTDGSGCTPRQCSSYPPNYASTSGWEVWAITSGTLTTIATTTITSTTTINPCTLSTYRWNTAGITVLSSSQMNYITDLYMDSNDTLYIVDSGNNVVWKLLKNAATATVVAGQSGSGGSSASQLNSPQSLYLDSTSNIYVSDYLNARIQKYVNGSTVGITSAGVTGTSDSALNHLNVPRGLVIDSTDTYVYIADYNNNRILRFPTTSTTGTNGVVVAGSSTAGDTVTQLNYPWGIHYLPTLSSYLYITNYAGHSVMRWIPGNSSGEFIAGTPGTPGSTATTLSNPVAIKLDSYLNMFVADYGNHRVQMFCQNNQTAITVAGTGSSGSSATQLNNPKGIAFDSLMNLYVADSGNSRVQKFLKL
ncbi:unnamed protein product [Adineta steineri]|uniref:NHL repeat containing protein n=1 Tax=Adineta steineri TaxID=433720 RepID=A0A813WAZ4_9BILA|nr:unnamed protein product [Adineta steineri]